VEISPVLNGRRRLGNHVAFFLRSVLGILIRFLRRRVSYARFMRGVPFSKQIEILTQHISWIQRFFFGSISKTLIFRG